MRVIVDNTDAETGVFVGQSVGIYFPNESGRGYTFVDGNGKAKLVFQVPPGQYPVKSGAKVKLEF